MKIKVCPLLSQATQYTDIVCRREKCAWWMLGNGPEYECAFTALVRILMQMQSKKSFFEEER